MEWGCPIPDISRPDLPDQLPLSGSRGGDSDEPTLTGDRTADRVSLADEGRRMREDNTK